MSNGGFNLGNIFTDVGHFWEALNVLPVIRSSIQQSLSAGNLTDKVKAFLSPTMIKAMESYAESLLPNIAPELKVAAGLVLAYDHDGNKWLQGGLNQVLDPSPNLAVDGFYGPATIAAVERFQEETVGLKKDGFAFKVTNTALQAALNKLLAKK